MPITIAAAASLVNGLSDVIAEFNSDPEFEDITVTVPWYGSSGSLARQILETPGYTWIYPDVFISASEGAMNVVQNGGKLVNASRFDWIGNALVLVKNSVAGGASPTTFESVTPSLTDMPTTHIWLANPYYPDYVPAGIYSETAFRMYTPDADHWGYVFGKAVYENTVRQDVQFTVNGVVNDPYPAIGVVYNSDALGAGLTPPFVSAPSAINNTIIYPAARVNQTGQNASEISAFLTFLNDPGNAARDIMIGKGFNSLPTK
jgi:molybdenum ABC transporter molybdate-binding protein